MSILDDLRYSINKLFNRGRENSYETDRGRTKILNLFAKDLVKKSFGLRNIYNLQPKHIKAVVGVWQDRKLKSGTLKNRTAVLRRVCERINKPNIILTNAEMGIQNRNYTPAYNKAIYNPDFSIIHNPYLRVSLELQRLFGLRREESLKIRPHSADKNDRLELMPTWCKGGRGRVVPIRTEEQRYWLEQAKSIAGKYGNSLIPEGKSYIRQRNIYEKQTARAGLKNLHGLRHAYAQQRYKELTGWNAPINGGLKAWRYTREEKLLDYRARMILSEELGHSREQITVAYLGR
jgi:hypothetical protein